MPDPFSGESSPRNSSVTMRHALGAVRREFSLAKVKALFRMSGGSDHVTAVSDTGLVFRFATSPALAARMSVEVSVLRLLRSSCGLPVPDVLFHTSTSRDTFPFAIMGYSKIEGKPLSGAERGDWDERWWHGPLVSFLKAMHGTPIENLPGDKPGPWTIWDSAREPSRQRSTDFGTEFLDLVEEEMVPRLPRAASDSIRRTLRMANELQLEWRSPGALIHGDLKTDHVLFDHGRRTLVGVIDFTDCAVGARDLDVWPEISRRYWGRDARTHLIVRGAYDLLLQLRRIIWSQRSARPSLAARQRDVLVASVLGGR